jgi:hypothetical protein
VALCPLPTRPTDPQPLPVARRRSDRGTVRAVSPRGSRGLLLEVLCEVLCREVLLPALTRMDQIGGPAAVSSSALNGQKWPMRQSAGTAEARRPVRRTLDTDSESADIFL